MIDFQKISYQRLPEILSKYNLFIDITNPFHCFSLIKMGKEVGLLCISEKDKQTAEISLAIFNPYKYRVLFKNNLIKIINFPFKLGYTQVISYTKIRSFVRLLERFSFEGVKLLKDGFFDDPDKEKIWFSKVEGGK